MLQLVRVNGAWWMISVVNVNLKIQDGCTKQEELIGHMQPSMKVVRVMTDQC